MTVTVSWPSDANDFDIYLYRVEDGEEVLVDSSTSGNTNSEQIVVGSPEPGLHRLHPLSQPGRLDPGLSSRPVRPLAPN